jgi:MFS family permease
MTAALTDPLPPGPDSPYAWRRLALSLVLATVGNVGMWAVIVMLPAVQDEFGGTRAEASLPYTLTMLGFALGNLLIGRIVDRFGITTALIGAGALLSAGYATAAVAPSLAVLSAVQFAVGFASAASFGPLIADLSLWFERRRGLAVALAACGNYLSGAVWPLILGPVMAASGWRDAAWLLAATCLTVMAPLALTLRRRVPVEALARADAAATARAAAARMSPRLLTGLLFVSGIGCCVAMSMPQVHIVAYCIDLGYGPAAGAGMLSVMLVGGVVSRVGFGLITDRIGGVRTLLIGAAAQLVALCLFLPWDGLVPLTLVSLAFGLAQGGIVPAYAVIVREYLPAREAGARVGFVIMATILGMALGGWMSGWIHDISGDYRLAFLNGIGWNVIPVLAMAALLLRRPGPRATMA